MIGYFELPAPGLIRFTGADAAAFLHGQLTCDVAGLAVGRSVYGGYCTPKGRVLATFLLWRADDAYFMQLPPSLGEPIRKRLSMYVLRAKVKVEDAAAGRRLLGLSGPDAADQVERAVGAVPRAAHDVTFTADATIIALPGDRLEIISARDAAPAIVGRLTPAAIPGAAAHWAGLDIRAGIPAVTPPTQEQFTPQMLNLDLIGGLSFTKGCYPGQEIVARTHYLGRLKQRMYRVRLGEGAPQAGDKLYSADLGDQACGMIVSAAPSPDGGYEALATMQIASAAGGAVRWKSPDGPPLEPLPLPYSLTGDA